MTDEDLIAITTHVNEPPKSEHDAGNVLTPDPAAIREAALREAVEAIKEHPASRCCDKDVSIWFQNTILALIPKGADHG